MAELLAFAPLSIVCAATAFSHCALAMPEIILKLTLVNRLILPSVYSLAMLQSILPLALVAAPIGIPYATIAMPEIMVKLVLIHRIIGPSE